MLSVYNPHTQFVTLFGLMSFAIPLILPQEDANGTVSYLEAFQYASDLGIDKYFKIDYNQLYGERIDFGELIVWGFDTLYSL